MAQRLLYEEEAGQVGKLAPSSENTFLSGGSRLFWRTIDAKEIPYTSAKSGPIANVSVALDQLLTALAGVNETINGLVRSNEWERQQKDATHSLVAKTAFDLANLKALSIPYTCQQYSNVGSVGNALDMVIPALEDVRATLPGLAQKLNALEGQQGDVLRELRGKVDELNRYVSQSVDQVTRTAHAQAAVSMVSNPALTIDSQRQTLNLDLSVKGSFDDSRSQLGVTSIQLALESISARQREFAYTLQAVNENLAALQKTQDGTARQVAALQAKFDSLVVETGE